MEVKASRSLTPHPRRVKFLSEGGCPLGALGRAKRGSGGWGGAWAQSFVVLRCHLQSTVNPIEVSSFSCQSDANLLHPPYTTCVKEYYHFHILYIAQAFLEHGRQNQSHMQRPTESFRA